MKYLIFIFLISMFQYAFAREEFPIIPTNGGYSVDYIENDQNLIDISNMKRKGQIENIQQKTSKKTSGYFRFNQKQIIEQNILDYMYRQNSSILPLL